MKTIYPKKKRPLAGRVEMVSPKALIRNMGATPGALRQIHNVYGVSATRLLEMMQQSKYPFVFPAKTPGQCDACTA